MQYAIISPSGIIENIIEAIDAPPGAVPYTDAEGRPLYNCSIGDRYIASVTMRQARLALLAAGLLPSVDAAIAALPEPQKSAAKIEWEYSQEVQRHNGFVSVLAPALGLTEAQIDALFVAGYNM